MALSRAMAARLREARQALEEAKQVRDDAIIAAFKRGAGMREIGDEVGMSHVGVGKLLERLGVRKRWTTTEQVNAELDARERAQRELDERGL